MTPEEAAALIAQWELDYAMGPWPMSEREKLKYEKEFRTYDEFNDGYISRALFIEAFSSHSEYQLSIEELQQVWSLADYNGKGRLDQNEFAAAMHVIQKVNAGRPMPIQLPLELIPLSHLSAVWGDKNPFRVPTNPASAEVDINSSLDPNPFERVVDELWISILEHLPKSSLLRVSRASRRFRDLSVPLLYRNVDLSLHDHEPYAVVYGNYSPSEPFRGHGPSKDDFRRTLQKQCRFNLQLLRKPEYGAYVRSFKWTLGLENNHSPQNILLPSWIEGGRFQWDPKRVYKIFNLLDHVLSIDIGGTSTRYYHFPDVGPLFPRAREIRLRGNMDYKLAWDILHGEDKASIVSLSLHDLHPEDYPASELDALTGPANMGRLLKIPSLQHRCQNIRSLFLCKLGRQHALQNDSGVLSHDEEVYHEWAQFISAVKPAKLVLAHSGLPDAPWNGRPSLPTCLVFLGSPQGPLQWPPLSPMDELFRDIVLPTLVKGWLGLANLEIRGVKRAVLQDLINTSKGINLRVEEEVNFCWHRPGRY
ncbi:hypothetical protein G7Y89_g11717 [Cudoniella acicularis]|uniref:EF-hand domain-containing protein n=1 Tax=Cudoniella acicularis TaxID=354080 RepID=A0A8H4VXL7_9HELO|nr:hypothetical protein G7Y89_g11717 [Cudoniella acicularis]